MVCGMFLLCLWFEFVGSILFVGRFLILLWKIMLFVVEVFLLFLFENELLNFVVLVSFEDFLFDYML